MKQAGSQRVGAFAWALLPVVLFLALHLRALDYDFVWTDQGEIEGGLVIRPPGRILAAFGEPMYRTLSDVAPAAAQPYYRPLHVVTLSLIDHHLGREPGNFRRVLFAVGAATMMLFFALVLPLTGDPRAAALAASLVAVHPAGIEDYVWIAGMAGAFAAFFVCASVAVVPYLMRARTPSKRAALVILSTLGLVGGLLSKESAIVTPALTLACIVSLVFRAHLEEPGRSLRERFATERAALLAVGVQLTVVLAYLLVARPALLGGTMSGAGPIRGDWTVHLMTVLATWADRLAWLFAPLQSTTSDVVPLAGPGSPMAWLGLVLGIAAPLVWLRLLRSGNTLAAFGWAWMWIAFLPTSGLVPLTHVVAVRYMSMSAFGAALICVAILEGLPSKAAHRFIPAVLAVALVLGLSQRTWARLPDWRDDATLFGRSVTLDPMHREGYYVLAVALAEQRQFSEARARLDQLRTVNGQFDAHSSFLRTEDVALLLCRLNLEINDPEDSLRVLKQELRPDSALLTSLPELLQCGAESLERTGRTAEARELFQALRSAGAVHPRSTHSGSGAPLRSASPPR